MLYAAEAKDIWQLTARERQSETEQESNNKKISHHLHTRTSWTNMNERKKNNNKNYDSLVNYSVLLKSVRKITVHRRFCCLRLRTFFSDCFFSIHAMNVCLCVCAHAGIMTRAHNMQMMCLMEWKNGNNTSIIHQFIHFSWDNWILILNGRHLCDGSK